MPQDERAKGPKGPVEQDIDEMLLLIAEAKNDARLFDEDRNVLAGKRVRKILMRVKRGTHDLRREISDGIYREEDD